MAKKNFLTEITTDNVVSGDCSFQITLANEVMLKALSKYAMMLDYITNAPEGEQLNVEGLINSILAEGMTKRIKELAKKHSFDDSEEFIDCMAACQDGEEVAAEIKNQERVFYQKSHDEILSHIPVEDNQKQLPLT